MTRVGLLYISLIQTITNQNNILKFLSMTDQSGQKSGFDFSTCRPCFTSLHLQLQEEKFPDSYGTFYPFLGSHMTVVCFPLPINFPCDYIVFQLVILVIFFVLFRTNYSPTWWGQLDYIKWFNCENRVVT